MKRKTFLKSWMDCRCLHHNLDGASPLEDASEITVPLEFVNLAGLVATGEADAFGGLTFLASDCRGADPLGFHHDTAILEGCVRDLLWSQIRHDLPPLIVDSLKAGDAAGHHVVGLLVPNRVDVVGVELSQNVGGVLLDAHTTEEGTFTGGKADLITARRAPEGRDDGRDSSEEQLEHSCLLEFLGTDDKKNRCTPKVRTRNYK